MIATQLECRFALPWRFEIVVFGGLGELALCADQFLPSGGGLRFKLRTEYNVNLK